MTKEWLQLTAVVLAVIGAVLSVVSGWYNLKLKRMELCHKCGEQRTRNCGTDTEQPE